MYLPDELSGYTEFDKTNAIEELTHVLTRSAIFEYAEALIKANKSFTFGIVDIDNFKMINDHYGHQLGDEILMQFAKAFEEELGTDGLIGRYGGDEFIWISTKTVDYDEVHSLIQGFYGKGHALRRTFCTTTGVNPFVTGTIGCSRFPDDAEDFNELFEKADKALYRGKTKGRNCFIIYLHEKHKNIDISKKSENSVTKQIFEMTKIYEKDLSTKEKFLEMINYISNSNNFYQVLLIDNNHKLYSKNRVFIAEEIDFNALHDLMDETGFITITQIDDIKDRYPAYYRYAVENNILSYVACEVKAYGKSYGFASLNDNQVARIWQEDDKVILQTLAKLFAYQQYNRENNK